MEGRSLCRKREDENEGNLVAGGRMHSFSARVNYGEEQCWLRRRTRMSRLLFPAFNADWIWALLSCPLFGCQNNRPGLSGKRRRTAREMIDEGGRDPRKQVGTPLGLQEQS